MLRGLRKRASLLSLSSNQSQGSRDENGDPKSNQVLKQIKDFETALMAMDYLLDDRTSEGTELLKKESQLHANSGSDQPAAIFPLALGVMGFIEATLGFEQDVMAKAHQTLTEAEEASLSNSKYNVKHQLATSTIYPPGTEFQVTHAESTLLNALVMLLQENNGMVESARALFKLRRAYQTLDSIYKKIKESEPFFLANLAKVKRESKDGNSSFSSVDLPGYQSNSSLESAKSNSASDILLMKNLEKVYQMRKARVEGTNLGNNVSSSSVNLFEGFQSTGSSVGSLSRKDSSQALDHNNVFKRSNLGSSNTSSNPSFKIIPPQVPKNQDAAQYSQEYLDDLQSRTLSSTPQEFDSYSVSMLSINSNVDSQDTRSANHLHVSTIDEFIHSGVQLCFGILQVVLSLIPPAIGKVLSIVGFRGDRETGLRMLWRTAISSRNIHGELALLCLLVFYDGPVQFIDVGFKLPSQDDANVKEIISIEDKSSVSDDEFSLILENPSLYTPQLLQKARRFFPHNALWVLQEGRMLAAHGKLKEATNLMQSFTDDPSTRIQMQQAEALLLFDRAMLYCFSHEFDKAAEDFIKLVEINSWSRGLYLFAAASCFLEKWRMIKMKLIKVEDEESALKTYSEKAEHYFTIAPSFVPGHGENSNTKAGIGGGKKMPFDKFLLRKIKHIEAARKENPNVSFVDCVGTSPFHELIYFWNGYNRMLRPQLEDALASLGYSGGLNSEYSANNDEMNYAKITESLDEAMIRYFLESIILRQLDKIKEGLAVLDNHVISKYVVSELPQFKFTKMTYSPYLYPTALYEKTMFVWLLRTRHSDRKNNNEVAFQESKSWLKKAEIVGDIGDYELSNRTSMRIKAAGERLDYLVSKFGE